MFIPLKVLSFREKDDEAITEECIYKKCKTGPNWYTVDLPDSMGKYNFNLEGIYKDCYITSAGDQVIVFLGKDDKELTYKEEKRLEESNLSYLALELNNKCLMKEHIVTARLMEEVAELKEELRKANGNEKFHRTLRHNAQERIEELTKENIYLRQKYELPLVYVEADDDWEVD